MGLVTLTLRSFDLETGVQVASKVRNLPFKFGHAKALGSGIIRYVFDFYLLTYLLTMKW